MQLSLCETDRQKIAQYAGLREFTRSPARASPRLAEPRLAPPGLAAPRTPMGEINPCSSLGCWPCLALPGLAWPRPAQPRRAVPRHAMPRRALFRLFRYYLCTGPTTKRRPVHKRLHWLYGWIMPTGQGGFLPPRLHRLHVSCKHTPDTHGHWRRFKRVCGKRERASPAAVPPLAHSTTRSGRDRPKSLTS